MADNESAARSESCLSTRKAKKTEDQTATEASNSSSGFFLPSYAEMQLGEDL